MRRALVTGSAGGFGTAIVERLRDDGLDVVGGDLPGLDVTDASSVERLVAEQGPFDVLVNNAGIAGPTASVEEYPLDAWRSVLDVNLTGTFLCTRTCIPHMRAAAGGGGSSTSPRSPASRGTRTWPPTRRRRRA